jgi:uncharacterized UBP type Zn finger protein
MITRNRKNKPTLVKHSDTLQKQNFILGKKRNRENEDPKTIKNNFKYNVPKNTNNVNMLKNNQQNHKYNIKEEQKKNTEIFNDMFIDSLMYWKHKNPPGSGLKNLGNTCFLNSVLQCIIYTAPLKNYINLTNHFQTCKVKICIICEYAKLSEQCGKLKIKIAAKKSPVAPQNIIANMKNIANHIKIGRQEDAHEFLLYFLEAMRISALKYAQTVNKKCTDVKILDEDNLIHKIFGCYLLSSVTCSKCKNSSNKIDSFVDISLVCIIKERT